MALTSRKIIYDTIFSFVKTSIGSLVGNRVFSWDQGYQDSDLPLALIQVITDSPNYYMGKDSLEMTVDVNIYGEADLGIDEIRNISDTLIADLATGIPIVGYDNNPVDVITAGLETREDEYYRIRVEFNLQGFK